MTAGLYIAGMRRLTAIIIGIVLTGAVAGCGGGGDAPADSGTTPPTASTPTKAEYLSSSHLTVRPRTSTAAELGYWEYLPPSYGEQAAPLLIALVARRC